MRDPIDWERLPEDDRPPLQGDGTPVTKDWIKWEQGRRNLPQKGKTEKSVQQFYACLLIRFIEVNPEWIGGQRMEGEIRAMLDDYLKDMKKAVETSK